MEPELDTDAAGIEPETERELLVLFPAATERELELVNDTLNEGEKEFVGETVTLAERANPTKLKTTNKTRSW